MIRATLHGLTIVGLLGGALIVVLLVALRPPLPLEAPPPGVTLADVTVINPGSGRREHQTVRVRGPTIESISDFSAGAETSPDVHTHAGSYVLPGLIDMHVHHPLGQLPTDTKFFDLLHLSNGVTTVRDCASIDGSILEVRARVAAGEFAGPRVFACGPQIDGDPPFWPGGRIARDAAGAERAVDEVAATGVDCVKAYSGLSADALRGLRDAATRRHLPLIGHVPIGVRFEEAHLDDVQHLTGVPGRTERPSDSGLIGAILDGWDTIDDARIDFVARTSVEQKIAHTPTIVAIQQILRLQNYPALLQDPAAHVLPRYYRALIWKPGGMASWSVPPLDDGQSTRILENICKVVRRLHAAGVTLHVGTDTFNPFVVPGVSIHTELRNFTQCGFTPEEAWEAATRRNGASLPLPGLGVLAPGAPADMLVFREDPTTDIADLSTLQAIVAHGRYYPKPLLEHAVARYHDYFTSWMYDRLTMFLFPFFAGSSRSDADRAARFGPRG